MSDEIIDSGNAPGGSPAAIDALPDDSDSDAELAKAEQRVKDAQSAMHAKSEEAALLRQQLDTLLAAQPQPEARKNPLEDAEFLEKVRDDPTEGDKVVLEEVTRLRSELAEVLAMQQEEFRANLRSVDPEFIGLKDKVAELKKEDSFRGFSEDQLLVIAKRESASAPPSIPPAPGAPAGPGRVAEQQQVTDDEIEKDPQLRAALKAMVGFDPYKKEEGDK